MKEVAAMLKAIHAQENKAAAQEKAAAVAAKLIDMKLKEATMKVEDSINETLKNMEFPYAHWSEPSQQQLDWAVKRGDPAANSGGTNLPGWQFCIDAGMCQVTFHHVASKSWGTKRYMSMTHPEEMQKEAAN